jgi:O-antigen ligase
MLQRVSHLLYGASLLTLPWIGVGLVRLLGGVDTGAGLQPAWFLLAIAVILISLSRVRAMGFSNAARDLWQQIPPAWRLGAGLAILAVLVSSIGLLAAPAQQPASVVWSRFLRQFLQLAIMGFFVLWPALWTRGRARWQWTIRLLLVSALIQAIYGLLQGISFYQPNSVYIALEKVFTSNPSILSGSEQLYLGNVFRNVPRLRGMACEPLYLGNYLLLILPWVVMATDRIWKRGLIGAVLVLLLLATWSRGAWMGLLVQVGVGLVLLILWRRNGNLPWPSLRVHRYSPIVWIGGLGLIVLVSLFLVPETASLKMPVERILQSFSKQDWSNLTRLYSMQAAWRAFVAHPIVGVGWGQFAWHFPVHTDPMGLQSQFDWPMVNNFPLQILCETGLQGFLVFLGTGLAICRAVVLRIRRPEFRPGLLLAATLGVAGIWAQLLTFSQYNLPHIWVAVGLLLAALQDDGSSDTEESRS